MSASKYKLTQLFGMSCDAGVNWDGSRGADKDSVSGRRLVGSCAGAKCYCTREQFDQLGNLMTQAD